MASRSLDEMALKGQRNYQHKVHLPGTQGSRSQMGGNYMATREEATSNYAAIFGPKRAAAYRNTYLTYGPGHYQPDNTWASKWSTNWTEAMQK